MTRGTGLLAFYRGSLAQFVSPVAHTHKCKKRAVQRKHRKQVNPLHSSPRGHYGDVQRQVFLHATFVYYVCTKYSTSGNL